MAYQMQYGNDEMLRTFQAQKKRPKKKAVLVFLIIVIVLGLLFAPGVREQLIPGDAEVTKQAADDMILRIRSGERVVDAFAQFCLEIIENS